MDVWSKRTTFSRSRKARQRATQGPAKNALVEESTSRVCMLLHATSHAAMKAPQMGAFARKLGVHHTPSRAGASCAAHREQHMHFSDPPPSPFHPPTLNQAGHPARMPAHTHRTRARRTHHKLQRQVGMTRTLCAASPGLVGGVCRVVQNGDACRLHATWELLRSQTA